MGIVSGGQETQEGLPSLFQACPAMSHGTAHEELRHPPTKNPRDDRTPAAHNARAQFASWWSPNRWQNIPEIPADYLYTQVSVIYFFIKKSRFRVYAWQWSSLALSSIIFSDIPSQAVIMGTPCFMIPAFSKAIFPKTGAKLVSMIIATLVIILKSGNMTFVESSRPPRPVSMIAISTFSRLKYSKAMAVVKIKECEWSVPVFFDCLAANIFCNVSNFLFCDFFLIYGNPLRKRNEMWRGIFPDLKPPSFRIWVSMVAVEPLRWYPRYALFL